MEAINPNDISKLDADTISFITLKDGNVIMIDESAPEKFISNNPNKITNSSQKNNSSQKLTVSKRLTFSYEGKNIPNINNERINSRYHDINEEKIIKNDFNLISTIDKNTNFELKSNNNNNNFNLQILQKNENDNIYYNNNNDNNNININPKLNLNKNSLKELNEKNKKNMTEEEQIDERIRRKSRNYLERLNLAFGEKNKQFINAVISLKIPSDINRQLNATQKEFDSMVTQLKAKRSKYKPEKSEKSIYQRYYELYKDNTNKELSNINYNKLKHYEEAAADDIENEELLSKREILGKNKFKNNSLIYNNNYNNLHGCLNLKGFNKTMFLGINDSNLNNNNNRSSLNSFYGNKTRSSINENKSILSSRLGGHSIGYSSTLVCPSNIFKTKVE